MNSLEKLIADLKDSKDTLQSHIDWMHYTDLQPLGCNENEQQMYFIMDAIKRSIIRLEALSEELERAE